MVDRQVGSRPTGAYVKTSPNCTVLYIIQTIKTLKYRIIQISTNPIQQRWILKCESERNRNYHIWHDKLLYWFGTEEVVCNLDTSTSIMFSWLQVRCLNLDLLALRRFYNSKQLIYTHRIQRGLYKRYKYTLSPEFQHIAYSIQYVSVCYSGMIYQYSIVYPLTFSKFIVLVSEGQKSTVVYYIC